MPFPKVLFVRLAYNLETYFIEAAFYRRWSWSQGVNKSLERLQVNITDRRKKIWRHDWLSQLYTQLKKLCVFLLHYFLYIKALKKCRPEQAVLLISREAVILKVSKFMLYKVEFEITTVAGRAWFHLLIDWVLSLYIVATFINFTVT